MNIRKFAPYILAGISTVGVVATAVLAYKAAPKVEAVLKETKDEDTLVKVKKMAPVVAPVATAGAVTIGCILGSSVLSYKSQAAIASAYIFLDRNKSKFEAKFKELFPDEYKKVSEEVVKASVSKEQAINFKNLSTKDENVCFYEEHHEELFEKSMIEVIDAEYQLNRKLALEGEVNLNDFFMLLGLNPTKEGAELGWNATDHTWIDFEHDILKVDDDLECYEIKYLTKPMPNYDVPF